MTSVSIIKQNKKKQTNSSEQNITVACCFKNIPFEFKCNGYVNICNKFECGDSTFLPC